MPQLEVKGRRPPPPQIRQSKIPAFRKGKQVLHSVLATPSPTYGFSSRKTDIFGKFFLGGFGIYCGAPRLQL